MDPLNKRIEFLIEKLGLKRHPEGGYYTETYRSQDTIEGIKRNVQTCIYFLLTSEDVSKFHRIKSDEIWFYHEGANLSIHTIGDDGHQIHRLGPINNEGFLPQILIPKNTIFGATLDQADTYVLVSCTVAPGFDFQDFELMNRSQLIADFPENEAIIYLLT
jgi:predicted cupin superfamily sugar epimerase